MNSQIIHLQVPDCLSWCVYRDRAADREGVLLPWLPDQSVKDCAESAGIPHTEIEKYLVAGEEVPESRILCPKETLEIGPADPLPFAERIFVLDVHLGKLAVFLRLAGFSVVYSSSVNEQKLIDLSHQNQHQLITRSRELLKHRDIERGMLVRSDDPRTQLKEVFYRFSLSSHVSILTVCPVCGQPLEPVSKQRILDRLKPGTIEHYQDFYQCTGCSQIFWEGSHYPEFLRMLEQVRRELRSEADN